MCSKTAADLFKNFKWNIQVTGMPHESNHDTSRSHALTRNTICSPTPRLLSRHERIRNIPALVRTVRSSFAKFALDVPADGCALLPRGNVWPAALSTGSMGRSLSETWSEYWNGLLLAPVLGSGRELHAYVQYSSGSHFSTTRAQRNPYESAYRSCHCVIGFTWTAVKFVHTGSSGLTYLALRLLL
jgi:hypothetical protein